MYRYKVLDGTYVLSDVTCNICRRSVVIIPGEVHPPRLGALTLQGSLREANVVKSTLAHVCQGCYMDKIEPLFTGNPYIEKMTILVEEKPNGLPD